MGNEIEKVEQSPLMPIISAASSNGEVDADKLLKLLEANEKYEAMQAKKAYHVAMAEFKKDPPKIIKDRNVNYQTTKGQTNYNHATLANVTNSINEALSEHGLTASWVTEQDGSVKVECKITHVLGHSESCSLAAAPDTSGSKNPIQAIGSTVTYLQRYTLLALTGLATYEQDDDGAGSEGEQLTETQEKVMTEICNKMIDTAANHEIELDCDKVAKVIYAQSGKYPNDIKKAGTIANWLIGILDKNETWNAVAK
jgi:hypothetical protein